MHSRSEAMRHPWMSLTNPAPFLWMALLAALAGCDAGVACGGCEIPQFTFSGGDAAPQTTAARVTSVPEAPTTGGSVNGGVPSRAGSTQAAGDTGEGGAAQGGGYTVVYRDSVREYSSGSPQATTSAAATPASSQGQSEVPDAAPPAASATSAAGTDSASPVASPEAPAPPQELNVVVVPTGGAIPDESQRANVAPLSPRSITYPPRIPIRGGP
jgi:hypothetical protein